MSSDQAKREPETNQNGRIDEADRRYAQDIAEHDSSPIGDTNEGTGTLRPDDDIGTGGTADVAGVRDFGDTSTIRTGNAGVGGILGTQLGDVGPATGAGGMSQEERGGLDALAERRSSSSMENGPVDRTALDRAEERIDTSSGGGLNAAAVEAAGLNRAGSADTSMPGTDDIGAAAGKDVGAGLGRTRAGGPRNPRGQISGVGGTRGSGAGTGHQEDTVR